MERSEPSLVPEWLKGASSGGGTTHHSQPPSHQDESGSSYLSRQRSQPPSAAAVGHGEYDSPRYSGSSERSFYPALRRAGSNIGGATERSVYERDSFTHARPYSSFGRSPLYRTHDGLDRDREGQRERDWDWDRDRDFRDRDRDRALGFGGGDDRDRDRERSDTTFRRPTTSGSAGRYESDLALRRSQSLGSNRGSENGEKKSVGELGGLLAAGLPTAPPVSGVSLTSSIQKAAFERNFPSLGAQERHGVIQSGLGNLSALSPRPSWQGSTPRPDGRAAASSPGSQSSQVSTPGCPLAGGGGSVGADGWSSALAEVSPLLSTTAPASNGVAGGMVISMISPTTSSSVPCNLTSSLGTSKMAEALAQNPRGRATPQFAVENQTQRLEELQFKQSRQLVPIKPVLPKNMVMQGVIAREKVKPKPVRAVDVVAPATTKLSQPLGSSQLLSAPYRPPAPAARTETLKAMPPGKLLVQRTRKEASPAVLLPASTKAEGSSQVSAATGGTIVSSAGGAASGASTSSTVAVAPRKQKQLLDRRAVPIAPISVSSVSDTGNGLRSKDGSDDKRPQVQAQNRSDFFNALRRKAAGVVSVSGSSEKSEVALVKCDNIGETDLRDTLCASFSRSPVQLAGYDANGVVQSSGLVDTISAAKNHFLNVDSGKDNSVNGLTVDGVKVLSQDSVDLSAPSATRQGDSLVGGSEEEEAAFLRSLGWEESAEGGEEALTEEEINAFYQERMRSMSDKPSLRHHGNLRLKTLDLYVGSIGSISSGLSLSDSESDDEVHTRC